MKTNSPKISKQFLESPEEEICNISPVQKKQGTHKKDLIVTDHSNMTLQDLITSLRDKISIYESEIQSLMNEILRMQIEINNLQLKIVRSKDINKNFFGNEPQLPENPLIELNKQITNESLGLKKEINNLNQSINKQKELINSPKFVSSFKNDKCPNCESKTEELKKLNEEKIDICSAIQDLKLQLEEMKKAQTTNGDDTKKKQKQKNKEKIDGNESLPTIEQYFILNNKFQLVDSDRNLWHMKKCQKFKQFKEEKKNDYSSADEILKAFVDIYEIKSEDEEGDDKNKTDDIKKNIVKDKNEEDSMNNQKKNKTQDNEPSLSVSNDSN